MIVGGFIKSVLRAMSGDTLFQTQCGHGLLPSPLSVAGNLARAMGRRSPLNIIEALLNDPTTNKGWKFWGVLSTQGPLSRPYYHADYRVGPSSDSPKTSPVYQTLAEINCRPFCRLSQRRKCV
jgi:hypothetical protein